MLSPFYFKAKAKEILYTFNVLLFTRYLYTNIFTFFHTSVCMKINETE